MYQRTPLEERADYLNYLIEVIEEQEGEERGASGLRVYEADGTLYVSDGAIGEPLSEVVARPLDDLDYEPTSDDLRPLVCEFINLWKQ